MILESQDHLMHGRRGDSEVLLHLGFRRRVPVDFAIIVDECQVLALLLSVGFHCRTKNVVETARRSPFKRCSLLMVSVSTTHWQAVGKFDDLGRGKVHEDVSQIALRVQAAPESADLLN